MIRLDFAQLFAPCLLLLPSFLGHLFEMTVNIPTRPLLTMLDAFPEGLPAPPIDMPDWSSMDYNQYAAFFQLKELGTFAIPLANVHVHQGQRPEDNRWVGVLQVKFVDDGIQANAHPCVAILNTVDIPLDANGKPDPSQMHISVISGLHRCTALWRMDKPEHLKFWIFRVHHFGISYSVFTVWIIWIERHFTSSDALFARAFVRHLDNIAQSKLW